MVAGGSVSPSYVPVYSIVVCSMNCAKQGSHGALWLPPCSERPALCLACF